MYVKTLKNSLQSNNLNKNVWLRREIVSEVIHNELKNIVCSPSCVSLSVSLETSHISRNRHKCIIIIIEII